MHPENQENIGLGVRCCDVNLGGGYQNRNLGIHCSKNRSEKNSEIFSNVWGGNDFERMVVDSD